MPWAAGANICFWIDPARDDGRDPALIECSKGSSDAADNRGKARSDDPNVKCSYLRDPRYKPHDHCCFSGSFVPVGPKDWVLIGADRDPTRFLICVGCTCSGADAQPSASARLHELGDLHPSSRCRHLEASVRHRQRLVTAKLRRIVVARRIIVDRQPRTCVGEAWNGVALVGATGADVLRPSADVVMLLGEGNRGCRQRRQNSCSGEN